MSSLHLVMSKGYRVNCMSATNSVILPKSTDAVYVSVNSVWLIVSATQHIYQVERTACCMLKINI